MLVVLALLLPTAHAEDLWPVDATISNAAEFHVNKDGFNQLEGLVPALLPAEPILIDPIGDESSFYAYALSGAWVGIDISDVEFQPGNQVLNAVIDLGVIINEPGTTTGLPERFDLYYEVFGADDTCHGYVERFPVHAVVPFTLAVLPGDDGHGRLDATMGDPVIENGLIADNIHLEDCAIGPIETVLNIFGYSLYDLIINIANNQLAAQIEDQRADLEATIEDALSAAYLNQDVDVNGIPLHLELYPESVDISTEGLNLGVEGKASAPASECVAEWDANGSLRTDPPAPAIEDDPISSHAGLLLSDDFANQALYSIWSGGLFCFDLSDGTIELPIALDTTLLGVLGGDPFRALFPEPAAMIVRTEPRKAPVIDYAGDHDITVNAHDIGLEFYADLDYRTVHALGVAIDADIGLDATFDNTTGALALAVDAEGEDSLHVRVPSNEFAAGTDEAIATAFSGLIDSIVAPLLGPALEGLAFSLPAMNGTGLTSLSLDPAGEDGTWLGAWAELGPVEYGGSGGCSGEDSGCGSGGCNGAPKTGVLAVFAAALGIVRRRRN